ncbi:MAG: DUF5668 domain-containing protein [Bacteroidota bacterium]
MNEKPPFRISPQMVFGVIVLLAGLLFLLDNFDVLSADEYLKYWPALLLAYGLFRLLQPGDLPGKFFGLLAAALGGLLLLDMSGVIVFEVWDFWPILLILMGLSLVFRAARRAAPAAAPAGGDGSVKGFVVMGGWKRSYGAEDFRGGELTAVMGGCELDLRQARMKGAEAVLDVFALWGGIEIKVPQDWTVAVEGVPLLGGFDDKTLPPRENPRGRLVIKGFVVMGGVEITN